MKKIIPLLATLLIFGLSGCAMTNGPVRGAHLTMAKGPVSSSGSVSDAKKGEASCISILGLFGMGDCTIQTAATNGNIEKISSVSADTFSVLGIFAEYTTIVHGE